jgi:trk system potassium uptake protein TrkH
MRQKKINTNFIIHVTGLILIIEAFFIFFDLIITLFLDSENIVPISEAMFITFFIGFILYFVTRGCHHDKIYNKEVFLIVSLAWVVMSLFGTLPYLLTHSISNVTDAVFETISGFTTTGASVVTDIEALPKSILFWRSETHWIGGIGIIVLFVALFRFIKKDSVHLLGSEFSNVTKEKILPKVSKITKTLIIVYFTLTATETIFLLFGGMSLFDSVCHAFATIATGGFSTKNDSIHAFSPYIQYVIIVFMFLSGINFNLYILGLAYKTKSILKNEELRLYVSIIAVVGAIITLSLYFKMHLPFEESFRESYFQVVSIITATGFVTVNYLKWPSYALLLIVVLMFTGASSSSTGGGIKVIRHLITFKYIKSIYKRMLHPHLVVPVRYNGKPISNDKIREILTFVFMYILIVAIGSLALITLKVDPETSFGSVLTCMGGIGPGLNATGPVSNFFLLPVAAKIILSIVMIFGRLEIYTILIIFIPSFWKK